MKKTTLLMICLFAGVFSLSAQQTLYVIDNETVEHFDGSQVKGRTIKDYKITTKGSGRNAITVHAITTAPSVFSFSGSLPSLDSLGKLDFDRFFKFNADSTFLPKGLKILHGNAKRIVYVVDGEKYEDASVFQSISPMDIESITVLKEGSPEQLKYGENVYVIRITTKKKKTA